MSFEVIWHEEAVADLKHLDKPAARQILDKVKTHLIKAPDRLGKPLKGRFKGLLRYRVGDFRVIYVIDHESKRIRILSVGHRSRIYSG